MSPQKYIGMDGRPDLSPGDLRDKDDFSRACRRERASIPVSEDVTDHQSRTGDQRLYMFSRWKPQRAARGQRPVRQAVGSLKRDEFAVRAVVLAAVRVSDLQGLEKLSAGQPADQRRPRRPLASPIHARITSLKCNPAALLEMATHGLQYRQRIGVGKQDLERMPGHDDQVEAPKRLVALRRRLDPLHPFRVRFASGHRQHRRGWINTRRPVTPFGEDTAQRARTATQIEDIAWAQSGEGDVEVGILRRWVSEVVNLCDLSVLIVHTLVALPPRRLPQPSLQLWLRVRLLKYLRLRFDRRYGVPRSGRPAPPLNHESEDPFGSFQQAASRPGVPDPDLNESGHPGLLRRPPDSFQPGALISLRGLCRRTS
jgi:hypothetical protein